MIYFKVNVNCNSSKSDTGLKKVGPAGGDRYNFRPISEKKNLTDTNFFLKNYICWSDLN